MNRLAHWMMRLYPARWRRRYGDEVRALVDDTGADMRVLADLFKGALFMQFSAWSFPRLAAMLGLAGMLAGLGVSLLSPAPYVARTEVTLTGTDAAGATMERLREEITSRYSLSSVINDPKLLLYRDEISIIPLEDVLTRMRNDIVFEMDGDRKIAIQFTYSDRLKAEMAIRELAKQFTGKLQQLAGVSQDSGAQLPVLEVVDTASLPTRPMRPDPWLSAAAGLAAGSLISLLWWASARFIFARNMRGFSRTGWTLAITGTLAGAAMSWVIPAIARVLPQGILPLRYESHATMYEADNTVPLGGLLANISSRTAMAGIIADPRLRLYSGELNRHSLEEVAEAMRHDVVITERGDGPGQRWLDISFAYTDPLKARQAVQSIMNLAADEFHRSVGQRKPARRPINWGSVAGPPSAVSIDNIAAGRATPMLTGFVIGLCLAAMIAIVRQRWTGNEEHAPMQTSQIPMLSAGRFRRLAPWLTVAGALGGILFVWLMPGRFTAEAVVALGNAPASDAAILIRDAISHHLFFATEARRNLSWEQLEAESTKTGTFRIRFVAGSPEHAREVLQDVLGEIDRAVVRRQGTFTPSFEEIRGVDGVLLPVPAEELKPQGDPYAESLSVAALPDFTSSPTISPAAVTAIPFDDERARPVARPPGAEIRMNVIDQPAALSGSDGVGLWAIAIGAASGLFLAWLLSIFGNIGTLFGQKSADVVNPSY